MIFQTLRTDLKTVLASINPIFSTTGVWKRTHYILMADLINQYMENSPLLTKEMKQDMGSTISYATLRRFFDQKYSEDAASDMRFLKSVDKLAIFLGYENFTKYNLAKQAGACDNVVEAFPEDEYFFELIKDFLHFKFRLYKELPGIDMSELGKVLPTGSPLLAQFSECVGKFKEKKLHLVGENLQNAGYKLISFSIICKQNDRCIVTTEENWNLVLESEITGEKYVRKYQNVQTYFLRKYGVGWKIWDNYNPDSHTMAKINAILDS